jgi:hypothetical protein
MAERAPMAPALSIRHRPARDTGRSYAVVFFATYCTHLHECQEMTPLQKGSLSQETAEYAEQSLFERVSERSSAFSAMRFCSGLKK